MRNECSAVMNLDGIFLAHEHLTTGSRVFISFIARVIYYGNTVKCQCQEWSPTFTQEQSYGNINSGLDTGISIFKFNRKIRHVSFRRYAVQDFLALNNDFCFHTLDATLVTSQYQRPQVTVQGSSTVVFIILESIVTPIRMLRLLSAKRLNSDFGYWSVGLWH